MNQQTRKIEVDAATAERLEELARDRGLSISDLIAELATGERWSSETVAEQIAELDRRSAAIDAGDETVPHEQVVAWLETWGTSSFRPWPGK